MAFTSKAVTVTGTLVDLNGTLLNGEIRVTLWDNVNFFDYDNKLHLFPEMVEIYSVTNGIVSFTVESSDNCTPAGINYNVTFKSSIYGTEVLLYRGPLDYSATPIPLDTIVPASVIALLTTPSLIADMLARIEALESGGATSIYAYNVIYNNPTYTNVEAALNSLLYTPPSISGFTTGISDKEVGDIVTQANMTWGITFGSRGLISSQSITAPQAPVIGAISTSARAHVHNSTYNPATSQSYTYTLSVGDGVQTVNASSSINFRWKRYWGAGPVNNAGWDWDGIPNWNPTDAQVRAFSQELASNATKTITYSGLNNQYIYYCYPNSWQTNPTFIYQSLPVTFEQKTRTFVNALGGTTTYRICRSLNLLTGDITISVS